MVKSVPLNGKRRRANAKAVSEHANTLPMTAPRQITKELRKYRVKSGFVDVQPWT